MALLIHLVFLQPIYGKSGHSSQKADSFAVLFTELELYTPTIYKSGNHQKLTEYHVTHVISGQSSCKMCIFEPKIRYFRTKIRPKFALKSAISRTRFGTHRSFARLMLAQLQVLPWTSQISSHRMQQNSMYI